MNLLITKDEADSQLGVFFNICAEFANSLFKDSLTITLLDSQKLKNNIFFSMTIQKLESFSFFAFTHGNEDGLCAEMQNYVDCNNIGDFSVANIVYNFSCLSGVKFGEQVVSAGANCFIGHNKSIFIQTLPKFQNYFYAPFELFIKNLAKKKTVKECIDIAKEKYTEEIDVLYKNDMLIASALLDNRDSIVCYGNSNVKI